MNDNELCEYIAQQWLYHGGDFEGFLYCISKIAAEIRKLSDSDNNSIEELYERWKNR